MKTSSNKKTLVHKTPQEIIHIKHTISARQYKYWFLLLRAYKDFIDNGIEKNNDGFYSIPMDYIKRHIGYEPSKKELKSDFEALRKEPIIINLLEKDKEPKIRGMGFISEWEITSTKISFKLPAFLEHVLKGDLKARQLFVLLNWNVFNSFSGKYEAILYKLCRDYAGVGSTPYMTIEEYRDYIGLKESEYTEFKALNRRTISEPIKRINNNKMSDIIVGVEFKKDGAKVLGLYFHTAFKYVRSMDIGSMDIVEPEPNPIFEKSLISIPPNRQAEYLSQYSQEQIEAILNYVKEQQEQGKIKNLGGFYYKSFQNGWGLENFEAEQKKKAEAEEKKRQAKAEIEAKKQAEKEAKEREAEQKAEREKYFEIFEALPQEDQEDILDELESQTASFMLKFFKKDRKAGLKPYKKAPYNFTLVYIMKNRNL